MLDHTIAPKPRTVGPYGAEAMREVAALHAAGPAILAAQKAGRAARRYEAERAELAKARRAASDAAASIADTPNKGTA